MLIEGYPKVHDGQSEVLTCHEHPGPVSWRYGVVPFIGTFCSEDRSLLVVPSGSTAGGFYG
jgi:hypothetical protein